MDAEIMDTPAKKLKLSLDPFESIHIDLHELIFQHFNNFEVLEASLVSSAWFDVTESSQKCMEKLHLRIVVPYSQENDQKFLKISEDLVSQRRYQNIYLHNFQTIVPEILKILTRGNWKKVFISTKNLNTKKDFIDIMELIEPSVENLSISLTSLRNIEEKSPVKNFSFPKLKILDLSRCHGLLMQEIAENCKKIKILKIDLDNETWRKHQVYLRRILSNNEELEKLTLWRCSAEFGFQLEAIKTYRFKLKNFCYKNSDRGSPSDVEENCLFDFLESQANSLQILRLEEWFGVEVFKLTFKMPVLRELTIDMYDVETTIDWEKINLNPSSSIKKFHIDSYRNNKTRIKIFNALFTAMPELKFLIMDYLDNDSLKSIGVRCQMLEELEVQELRAAKVHDPIFFPNIKRFHCEDRISMKIKRRINMKPVEDRTAFEKLILGAKPYFVTK